MTKVEQSCKAVSISELLEMNITVPRYQREDTWTLKQKQFLIDSIILGLPIPAFILCVKDGKTVFDIVDAKHRYTSIKEFINNNIPFVKVIGEKRMNVFYGTGTVEGDALICDSYKNVMFLNEQERNEFNNYVVVLHMYESDDEALNSEIFKRVNTSGKKASKAEIKASQTSGSEYHVTLNSILKASENVLPDLKHKIMGFFECLDKEKTGTDELRYMRLTNDKSIKSLKYSNVFHKIEVYTDIAKNIIGMIDEPYDNLLFKIPPINFAINGKIDDKFNLTAMDAIHDFNIMYRDLEKAFICFGGVKFSLNKRTFNETLMCVFTALIKVRASEIGPKFTHYWTTNYDVMIAEAETRFPTTSIDSASNIASSFKFVNEFINYAILKVDLTSESGK